MYVIMSLIRISRCCIILCVNIVMLLMYSIVMSVIIDLKVEFDMFLIVIGVRFSLIIVIIVLVMMGGISVLI